MSEKELNVRKPLHQHLNKFINKPYHESEAMMFAEVSRLLT